MPSTYRHQRATIGVLAGWQFYRTATNLSYLAPIYRGISKAARDLGCNLLLGCGMGPSASPTDPMKPAWSFASPDQDFVPIGDWNTDGLIIALPLHSDMRSEHVRSLIRAGHPIIFIGSGETGTTILADNSGGMHVAMSHLLHHGHRDIAFIAGSQDDMRGDTGERLQAYQVFCKNHHLNTDPRLVAFGLHIYSGGHLAMQQILESGCEFTAVMASNDESALGAMDALTAAGLKIPQDVAVIGFDNRLEGAVEPPGLTSVHVPLFDIGYQAVELLLKKINENNLIVDTVKVETRLIVRYSCGCGTGKLPDRINIQPGIPDSNKHDERVSQLIKAIARTILNQAQSLTEDECLSISRNLVETYITSVRSGNHSSFWDTLTGALQRTEEGDDDVHLWQEAVSLLESGLGLDAAMRSNKAVSILDEARQTISAQMQQQHRRYVIRERWKSSRVSLLTAELIRALDETHIYDILAKHLPDMKIRTTMLVLFEPDEENPFSWSTIRDVFAPELGEIRFLSREFPPTELFDKNKPFHFTLIPIVDQSGQLGFTVFDTEHLDLYGAIVQQLGSAFNTIRLYRQATEGRRLAEEANRMKSRFLSTISHELRTPLNLIVGLSGVVLHESEEDNFQISESAHEDIKRIHAYAQHLGGLIGDVIDLASLDSGQLRLNKELIDLKDALQLVVESGSQLAMDKGLTWFVDMPETGPWVWGDRTRLRQVVFNLINNAIKFTDQGEIRLTLTMDDHLATLSVSDTGLGIHPEEQVAVFDAFRRSERSIDLGYPGLGLGLAICKMLIEMHDGTIAMRSSGIEGEGTDFYFTLPVVSPQLEIESKAVGNQPSDQSVLLLSAQPGANQKLRVLLSQRGLNVQEALIGNSLTWQSQLSSSIPDLIVLDVSTTPDLSWSTLKAIKENPMTRGVQIFLYASSNKSETLLSLDYLTKPIVQDELIQSLDQYWISVDPKKPIRTILVVDDEPNTLDLHARIVKSQSSHNRVLLANHGNQALQILRQEQIDLVLLDLQMPEMDGFGVLAAMREDKKTCEIPVIVVTGKVLSSEDMDRLKTGVTVVLQKGLFSVDETVAHIEKTLANKRSLSAETQNLVRQAMAYIHAHYFDSISRKDIAQSINISEDYLTFCFRQELGTTPIKYLQRYRINLAKTLLKESQKTITEIALDVGFSDSGYFSRIFNRETGMPPDQYRRS